MRLLNTTTITLETFMGSSTPPYAILSHRWDQEEVTFDDIENGRGRTMPGYAKIAGCCSQALSDGWKYVWIDSCCIDKSSSAELSESINSMFNWYRDSQVCYAYLSDVDGSQGDIPSELRRSKWFERGWTLQELLAPSLVVFFDKSWVDIGTRRSLEATISEITGVEDFVNFKEACVAQKMCWASKRVTTRMEDEAYCLMGLFDVNMPLLYGEGDKAFVRLQQEIIKMSDDQSIFAWYSGDTARGLLATSPKAFELSSHVRHQDRETLSDVGADGKDLPFTMTNRGLAISLYLFPAAKILELEPSGWDEQKEKLFVTPLRCYPAGTVGTLQVIFLVPSPGQRSDTFQRTLLTRDFNAAPKLPSVLTEEQFLVYKLPPSKLVYIPQHTATRKSESRREGGLCNFSIGISSLREHDFECIWQVPVNGAKQKPVVSKRTTTTDWSHKPVSYWDPWVGSSRDVLQCSVLQSSLPYECVEMYFQKQDSSESLLLIVGMGLSHIPWFMVVHWKQAIKDSIYDYMGRSHFSRYWNRKYVNTLPSRIGGRGPSRWRDMEDASLSINSPNTSKKRIEGVDRISKALKNGECVHAALRLVPGDKRSFAIDVDVSGVAGEVGALRWPEPVWLVELEADIATSVAEYEG